LHKSKKSFYPSFALRLIGPVVNHNASQIKNNPLYGGFVFIFWLLLLPWTFLVPDYLVETGVVSVNYKGDSPSLMGE